MSGPGPRLRTADGARDGATAVVALLVECLDAARAAARQEPRSADRLRAAGERLDGALAALPALAADARDRAADLVVGLSAAGVAPAERDGMAVELLGVLGEVSAALRAPAVRGPAPKPPPGSASGAPPGSWQRGGAAPH
ncbi:hypothetical protein [Actinotalea sp. Marseille-Q4924]|uniref:hypothetical protein n=1 Tax=Actinotalea sp. Marseille-Q4924 TaxID=2866571 RepID=UPI001CE4545C|nr:hypothetical protein [Actinotalea sp. Marseille-Q4924]